MIFFFFIFYFPPGYFMILKTILKAPGPPGPLNKPKNRFFQKSQHFQKITKIIKIPLLGLLPLVPGEDVTHLLVRRALEISGYLFFLPSFLSSLFICHSSSSVVLRLRLLLPHLIIVFVFSVSSLLLLLLLFHPPCSHLLLSVSFSFS